MKKIIPLLCPVLLLLSLMGCQSGQGESDHNAPPALLGYFTSMMPADTLHFFLDSDPLTEVREVPTPILYEALDSALFYQMGYLQDSAATQAQARGLFPLDAEHDAALLSLQEGWYAFQYLLIFDKTTNQFTHVTPVCEFYGGDGGQIRSESWLFFEDPPKLLSRYSERWLQMGTEDDPDEVLEKFHESVRLQEWLGLEWRKTPVVDSSRWIADFPVAWW